MAKKVALLIAVDQYAEGLTTHQAASHDVEAMQRVLQEKTLGDFNRVELLINPNVETIKQAINNLVDQCGVNDLALVFFSGKGIINQDGKLYLTTSITTKDNLEGTTLPASFLHQQLSRSDAQQQIVILECDYYSASVDGWLTEPVSVNLKEELSAPGRAVLTSSTTTQTSFKQEPAHCSLYTQYLVEGIETGAADRDGAGLIYVRELHNYATEKVQTIKSEIEPALLLDNKGLDILLTILMNQDPNHDPDSEYRKIEAKYRKIVENYERYGKIPEIVQYTLTKKHKELGITVDLHQPDQLISDQGIDYSNLRDLLRAGKWKEADQETFALMVKAVDRDEDNNLDPESIKNFPCTDLHTIEGLWLKYSSGQFGFSLQKEIWEKLGGKLDSDDNNVDKLEFNRSVYVLSSYYNP
ncbi:MAG: caspase, partial [Moorea sp. SIO2I5]|nr:caspase [Moorena sp. SIO2I5]